MSASMFMSCHQNAGQIYKQRRR